MNTVHKIITGYFAINFIFFLLLFIDITMTVQFETSTIFKLMATNSSMLFSLFICFICLFATILLTGIAIDNNKLSK